MELDNIYISKLSEDIINIILSYGKHFVIRKGRPINIIPKDDLGIETKIAVYEYPMLDKCIWSLYNYYPNMMVSLNVQTIHF